MFAALAHALASLQQSLTRDAYRGLGYCAHQKAPYYCTLERNHPGMHRTQVGGGYRGGRTWFLWWWDA